jgi:hypothetical protein
MNIGYESAANTLVNFGSDHTLIGLLFQPIDDGKETQVSPPSRGSATSFFDIFAEVTLDGHQYMGDGSVRVQITDPPSSQLFDLQILSLDISGGTLPTGTEIMLEPTPPSTGMEMITPDRGGFMISSFFDIFTELSLDGGQTFTPGSAPILTTGVPLPSSLWAGLGMMALAAGLMMRRKPATV